MNASPDALDMNAPAPADARPRNNREDSQGGPLIRETPDGASVVAPGAESTQTALAAFANGYETHDDLDVLRAAARSGILRVPKAGGRHEIDDKEALIEVHLHVQAGRRVESAALLVARGLPGQSVQAITKRLARKYRKKIVKCLATE